MVTLNKISNSLKFASFCLTHSYFSPHYLAHSLIHPSVPCTSILLIHDHCPYSNPTTPYLTMQHHTILTFLPLSTQSPLLPTSLLLILIPVMAAFLSSLQFPSLAHSCTSICGEKGTTRCPTHQVSNSTSAVQKFEHPLRILRFCSRKCNLCAKTNTFYRFSKW